MRLLSARRASAAASRRGAALLLAFLVLIVIVAITYQIHVVTRTDAKVAHNDITRATMDLALESAFLQVLEDLAEDGRGALAASEAGPGAGDAGDGAGAGERPGGGGPGGDAPGDGGDPATEDNADAVDSMMDGWYTPQSTNFGDVQVRIFVRDEDSKYNVLNLLQPDEELAEAALARVARILDLCREGTDQDISPGEADEMARAMLEHMQRRGDSILPDPVALNDVDGDYDRGMPLTFAEFRAIEPFRDDHFQEGYDVDGNRVHSIEAFLTIYSSPTVGDDVVASAPTTAETGWAVNVNTAPLAVLAGLFDHRDINPRLWDEIRDYRNLEEEEDPEADFEDTEPILDEYGQEVVQKRIFDSLDELEEVYEYQALLDESKQRVQEMLKVESNVFEIILAARLSTAAEQFQQLEFRTRREQEEYFRSGTHIVRAVRMVVWRRATEDDIEMVPLVRWEVLDDPPLQVLDFPEDY